jgi:hypothetical protein
MRLSLNEIEVTARKAALGAGLPLGLAEDTGMAAAWLAAAGFPVAELMRSALETTGPRALRLQEAEGGWRLAGEASPLPALVAGPSASDLAVVLAKEGCGGRLRLRVDVPAIAFAHSALASARAKLSLAFSTADSLAEADIARLSLLRDCEVTIEAGGGRGAQVGPAHDGIMVEPTAWAAVQALANRMLVPATRHSRERGAGAGLIDTD